MKKVFFIALTIGLVACGGSNDEAMENEMDEEITTELNDEVTEAQDLEVELIELESEIDELNESLNK